MTTAYAAWLGRRAYGPVHELQNRLLEARAEGTIGDTILLLEHEPVATLGRKADRSHLVLSEEDLRARGVELIETGRGGEATFHGPGQLVVYPILDLKPDRCDVRRYVRDLGRVMIGVLGGLGLSASMLDGPHLGVWVDRASPRHWPDDNKPVDPAKVGAIGVRISRWVTMHGFALNGSTDLSLFRSSVVPCGITDRGITSIEVASGRSPPVDELARLALPHLASVFGLDLVAVDLSNVGDQTLNERLLAPPSSPPLIP